MAMHVITYIHTLLHTYNTCIKHNTYASKTNQSNSDHSVANVETSNPI